MCGPLGVCWDGGRTMRPASGLNGATGSVGSAGIRPGIGVSAGSGTKGKGMSAQALSCQISTPACGGGQERTVRQKKRRSQGGASRGGEARVGGRAPELRRRPATAVSRRGEYHADERLFWGSTTRLPVMTARPSGSARAGRAPARPRPRPCTCAAGACARCSPPPFASSRRP